MNLFHGGDAVRGLANTKWRMPGHPTTGPHATGIRHGRQEATSQRVSVWSYFALSGLWQKIKPMPKRRKHAVVHGRWIVPIQGGRQATDRRCRDQVMHSHAVSLPCLKVGQRVLVQEGHLWSNIFKLGVCKMLGLMVFTHSGDFCPTGVVTKSAGTIIILSITANGYSGTRLVIPSNWSSNP